MRLKLVYEKPHTDWSVLEIFEGYKEILKNQGHELIIELTNSLGSRDPNKYGSPHTMVVENLNNNKFLVISYWDSAAAFFYENNGWNQDKCCMVYTSSGVKNEKKITPISYPCYSKNMDSLHLSSIPLTSKPNNFLHFRGYLYGSRLSLSENTEIEVVSQRLNFDAYIKELTNNKICLSLNGAGEICNRDIEILGSRSVLFREKLNQSFHNSLVDGIHYISFEHDVDPKKQVKLIVDKFNEISDNLELLSYISENGYNWFKENGTVKANIRILNEVINLEQLL